jgi:hypothetical protein
MPLTKTHTCISERFEVTAWRYDPKAPMPIWVARKFHNLDSSDTLTALTQPGEIQVATPGDWLVTDGAYVTALPEVLFNLAFVPINTPLQRGASSNHKPETVSTVSK